MSGVEISIPLTLVAIIQFIGLGAKYLLDFRIKRLSTISDAYIVGIMLLIFNVLRIIQGQHNSIFDSIAFAILCGFTSTLLFQNEIQKRIRFFIIALSNSILFLIVLMLSKRIQGIDFHDQMLFMAVALNIYFVAYSFVTFFKAVNKERFYAPASRVALGVLSIACAFATVFLSGNELYGLLTVNFLFVAIILIEFAKHFFFNDSEDRVIFIQIEKEDEIEDHTLRDIQDFQLTERQLEIALLMLKRMSRAEIAEHLGIKEPTVGSHANQIFKKTKTYSRSDFILKFKDKSSED